MQRINPFYFPSFRKIFKMSRTLCAHNSGCLHLSQTWFCVVYCHVLLPPLPSPFSHNNMYFGKEMKQLLGQLFTQKFEWVRGVRKVMKLTFTYENKHIFVRHNYLKYLHWLNSLNTFIRLIFPSLKKKISIGIYLYNEAIGMRWVTSQLSLFFSLSNFPRLETEVILGQ